jgi:hypothetical protein
MIGRLRGKSFATGSGLLRGGRYNVNDQRERRRSRTMQNAAPVMRHRSEEEFCIKSAS